MSNPTELRVLAPCSMVCVAAGGGLGSVSIVPGARSVVNVERGVVKTVIPSCHLVVSPKLVNAQTRGFFANALYEGKGKFAWAEVRYERATLPELTTRSSEIKYDHGTEECECDKYDKTNTVLFVDARPKTALERIVIEIGDDCELYLFLEEGSETEIDVAPTEMMTLRFYGTTFAKKRVHPGDRTKKTFSFGGGSNNEVGTGHGSMVAIGEGATVAVANSKIGTGAGSRVVIGEGAVFRLGTGRG